MQFTLPPLPYPASALEPIISREALELHHARHHQAYVDKLNEALAGVEIEGLDSVEQLLRGLPSVPDRVREKVRNFGGGHANHTLLWETLTPSAGKPSDNLLEHIDRRFGSLTALREELSDRGEGLFGSGWVFLAWDDAASRLELVSLPNQDSPLSRGMTPLLPCDLWEHAHYLQYRNKRADWIRDWWYLIDWQHVEHQLERVQPRAAGQKARAEVAGGRGL